MKFTFFLFIAASMAACFFGCNSTSDNPRPIIGTFIYSDSLGQDTFVFNPNKTMSLTESNDTCRMRQESGAFVQSSQSISLHGSLYSKACSDTIGISVSIWNDVFLYKWDGDCLSMVLGQDTTSTARRFCPL